MAFLAIILLAPRHSAADGSDTDKTALSEAKTAETEVIAQATGMEVIASVHIGSKDCASALADALDREGIRVAENGRVDVILKLKLKPQKGWFTDIAFIDHFFRGFNTRAGYEVRLIGLGNQTVLSLHGEERALTGREMCQDIADNIADRLTKPK